MAFNINNEWLESVIARVENRAVDQPVVQGMLSQTNIGKQCLIVGGFEYKKGKVVNLGAVQNWRCIESSCNGTAKTNFGSLNGLRLVNSHVCRHSPNAFARRDVIDRVKTAAMEQFGSAASRIVSSAKSNLMDAQLLSIPTDKGLQDRVLRKKKPVGASSVDRPVGEIIWLEYFQTTERGEQFFFHDSRASEPDLPVIFLFLSSSGLRLLRENLRWDI